MRTYPANDHALSQLLGGSDPKTINKYMWPFIQAVFDLNYESEVVSAFLISLAVFFSSLAYIVLTSLPNQICFENRKMGDVGNDCLLSVDGTDFRIAMGYNKAFWSYKFKKSGLRYEVALCIKTGDICWWSGPYAPGYGMMVLYSRMGW